MVLLSFVYDMMKFHTILLGVRFEILEKIFVRLKNTLYLYA